MAASTLTAQQAYIMQSFQSQVYIQNQMDVQDEPIYDTLTFPTGGVINPTTAAWFASVGPAAPIYAGSAINKTLAQTNLTKQNTLIAPEAQAIYEYRIQFNESIDPRDMLAITGAQAGAAAPITGFAFQFSMGTKAYQTGPVALYQAHFGVNFQGTAAGQSFLQNGFPSSMGAEALSVNLVIENEESFYGYLQGLAYTVLGTNGVSMKLLLMGLHARPIR
jgi:hypothetical protein